MKPKESILAASLPRKLIHIFPYLLLIFSGIGFVVQLVLFHSLAFTLRSCVVFVPAALAGLFLLRKNKASNETENYAKIIDTIRNRISFKNLVLINVLLFLWGIIILLSFDTRDITFFIVSSAIACIILLQILHDRTPRKCVVVPPPDMCPVAQPGVEPDSEILSVLWIHGHDITYVLYIYNIKHWTCRRSYFDLHQFPSLSHIHFRRGHDNRSGDRPCPVPHDGLGLADRNRVGLSDLKQAQQLHYHRSRYSSLIRGEPADHILQQLHDNEVPWIHILHGHTLSRSIQ